MEWIVGAEKKKTDSPRVRAPSCHEYVPAIFITDPTNELALWSYSFLKLLIISLLVEIITNRIAGAVDRAVPPELISKSRLTKLIDMLQFV